MGLVALDEGTAVAARFEVCAEVVVDLVGALLELCLVKEESFGSIAEEAMGQVFCFARVFGGDGRIEGIEFAVRIFAAEEREEGVDQDGLF